MLIIPNICCTGDKRSEIKTEVFLQSPSYWERFSSYCCIAMFGKTERLRKKELISIGFFYSSRTPYFFTLAFFSSLTHPRIGVPIATTSKVKLLQIKIEHLMLRFRSGIERSCNFAKDFELLDSPVLQSHRINVKWKYGFPNPGGSFALLWSNLRMQFPPLTMYIQ